MEICGLLALIQIFTSPTLGSASGITAQVFKSTDEEQPSKVLVQVPQTAHP